jgi:hypothetical protein
MTLVISSFVLAFVVTFARVYSSIAAFFARVSAVTSMPFVAVTTSTMVVFAVRLLTIIPLVVLVLMLFLIFLTHFKLFNFLSDFLEGHWIIKHLASLLHFHFFYLH